MNTTNTTTNTNLGNPTVLAVNPNIHQALWAQFVAPVLDGSEGYVRELSIPGVTDLATLFPLDAIVADVTTSGVRQVLVVAGGWAAWASAWKDRETSVWVRAADADVLAKAVAEIRGNAPIVEPAPETVSIDFWQVGNGAYTTSRTILAPEWTEIAPHYPDDVATELARLMTHEPDVHGGRIVLWYGPPGTGKTTAIRALARAWNDRARVQVVLDPDAVLSRSARLMEVLLADDEDQPDRWRVLVIEDADELVRADAKDRVGQALSRLLNVGDGIVGQGLKVIVLITTNERVDRVHPALARPGRCLAQTYFRRFTRAEARAWRGDDIPAGNDFSLAELMTGQCGSNGSSDLRIGQYL